MTTTPTPKVELPKPGERAPHRFWQNRDNVAAAVAACGSRHKLNAIYPGASLSIRTNGWVDLLPPRRAKALIQGPVKYTEQWLRDTLTANPRIKTSAHLRKLNENGYCSMVQREWFKPVLAEFNVEIVQERKPRAGTTARPKGYWTAETVAKAIADAGWTTRAQMRACAEGRAVIASCKGRGLTHLLPPPERGPNAQEKTPAREKPRGRARVAINCWPFEGPATKVDAGEDTAVESAA